MPGRGGGWSPKATRREDTVGVVVRGGSLGLGWVWWTYDRLS